MHRVLTRFVLLLFLLTACSVVALADQVPVGFISFDAANAAGTSGQFDITNQTGANSFAPLFPVTSGLTFTITSLTIDFVSGGSTVLNPSNFTADGSGGWLGNNAFTAPILSAALLGTLSPTTGVAVAGLGTETISANFEDATGATGVTMADASGGPLVVGSEIAVIYAGTGGTVVSPVPEPPSALLMGAGLAILIGLGVLTAKR
jgi:hypothetical protein